MKPAPSHQQQTPARQKEQQQQQPAPSAVADTSIDAEAERAFADALALYESSDATFEQVVALADADARKAREMSDEQVARKLDQQLQSGGTQTDKARDRDKARELEEADREYARKLAAAYGEADQAGEEAADDDDGFVKVEKSKKADKRDKQAQPVEPLKKTKRTSRGGVRERLKRENAAQRAHEAALKMGGGYAGAVARPAGGVPPPGALGVAQHLFKGAESDDEEEEDDDDEEEEAFRGSVDTLLEEMAGWWGQRSLNNCTKLRVQANEAFSNTKRTDTSSAQRKNNHLTFSKASKEAAGCRFAFNNPRLVDFAYRAKDAKGAQLAALVAATRQGGLCVDLHWLFVHEAVPRVRATVQLAQQQGLGPLTIVCGDGNGSPGKQPRLAPSVAEMLDKLQHKKRWVTSVRRDGGTLTVHLQAPDPVATTCQRVSDTSICCCGPGCDKVPKSKCSACNDTVYCSRDCQKRHWAVHRLICFERRSSSG